MPEPGTHPRFTILPAEWKDLNALRKLERICFPLDRWPMLDLIAVLSFPGIARYKAVVDGKLVGFAAGDVRQRDNTGWISTIAVHPAYRRMGIATALLETCEASLDAPAIRLTVRKSNEAAIHLYRQRGYYQVGVWPDYYQDHEDGIIFEKPLE
jgi:ribosomal-protein-alanine N-acetyltransferase